MAIRCSMAPVDDNPESLATTPDGREPAVARGPAAPAFGPGAVVGGRFVIEGELGAGGMGLVYRAYDRTLDHRIALKVLRADLEGDPRLRDSFRREVRLARLVTHPGVCRLHDLEEAGGRHFVTMELIEGETLAQRLARGPRLPWDEVTRIGLGIAAGLGAAHQQGVLHLDLKPGNVMLERSGRVVVMDFGVARALQPSGAATHGAVAGTVAYMAPEQLAGEDLDQRVDIYALGLVMYEMACGRVPGHAESVTATAETRRSGPAPDPRLDRPDVPERFRRVVRRCLAPRRADRYASAAEVLQDLGVEGADVGMAGMTGRFTIPAPPRRRRRWALAAALVALLAVAAAAVAVWRTPGVRQVARVAVVVDESQPAAGPAAARLRRAAVRLVARELGERGLIAAPDSRPAAGVATARVRVASGGPDLVVTADLVAGRTHLTRTARAPTLVGAATQVADAMAAVVRTPAPPLDQRALARTGATTMAAAREVELARAAVLHQDRERARRHAARALELEPALVAPHLVLAAIEEPYTDASRAHLRRALAAARGRDDLTSQFARARALYEVDANDAGGRDAFAALYAAHPDDPDVAYYYADVLGDLWQVDKANAILERLLEQHPGHLPAMLRLFDLRINQGDIAQLLRDGARLIELVPEAPQAYVIYGRTLLAAGRLDEALATLAEALVIDPAHPTALTFAGRTLLYKGDLDGARTYARRLLVGPRRSRAAGLRTLGLAAVLEGRFAEGQRHLQESLAVDPDDAADNNYIHKVLTYTAEDLGDFETALAAAKGWEQNAAKATFWSQIVYARQEQDICLLRLKRLTPAEFGARLPSYLAFLASKSGADVVAGHGPKLRMYHAAALGEFRESLLAALKDEVPASTTQFQIANAYAHLGQHGKAAEWYHRILTRPDEELIPTVFVRARLRYGQELEAQGKLDEARAAFERFLAAWAGADRPLPEVEEARRRLAVAAGGARP